MPVDIDGQIIRNIPEQVLENMNDIEQLKYDIAHIDLSNCAKLDGNNVFTGNNDFANLSVLGYEVATKAYVSAAIETVKRNAFIKVNIDIYPTLADFLLSDGEEGYIYLYPIDPSEAPTFVSGFYQYIWEDNDWLGVGTTKIDLSNYVDLTSAQTITGQKTLKNSLFLTTNDTDAFKIEVEANRNLRVFYTGNAWSSSGTAFFYDKQASSLTLNGNLLPKDNNSRDLGSLIYQWRDLFLARNLTDGTNSATVADISNGIFNVIKASDIVSNTLTPEQFALITNGKPTLIKGTFATRKDLFILGTYSSSTETWGIASFAVNFNTIRRGLTYVYINNSTLGIQVRNNAVEFGNNAIFLTTDNGTSNTIYINGKKLPDHPSNTGTFVLKCVDGTLTWVQE